MLLFWRHLEWFEHSDTFTCTQHFISLLHFHNIVSQLFPDESHTYPSLPFPSSYVDATVSPLVLPHYNSTPANNVQPMALVWVANGTAFVWLIQSQMWIIFLVLTIRAHQGPSFGASCVDRNEQQDVGHQFKWPVVLWPASCQGNEMIKMHTHKCTSAHGRTRTNRRTVCEWKFLLLLCT